MFKFAILKARFQALNVVENLQFRQLLLLLRGETLEDSDIPHRTKICTAIMELLKSHFQGITKDLQVFSCHVYFLRRLTSTWKC